MKFPIAKLDRFSREDLELLSHVIIHAKYELETGEQTYICYALESYQPRSRSQRSTARNPEDRAAYYLRRRAVTLARWIVRDALSPQMSFETWFRRNNPDKCPLIGLSGLGLTKEMYERRLRERLELYRPLRVEWLSQILAIINMKL